MMPFTPKARTESGSCFSTGAKGGPSAHYLNRSAAPLPPEGLTVTLVITLGVHHRSHLSPCGDHP